MAKEKRIWPKCGKEYIGYPAISRDDNKTEICPNCGTREALKASGMSDEIVKDFVETSKYITKSVNNDKKSK